MTQSGIPQSHVDLLTKKALHLVTLLPDGKPQSTPVWVRLRRQVRAHQYRRGAVEGRKHAA